MAENTELVKSELVNTKQLKNELKSLCVAFESTNVNVTNFHINTSVAMDNSKKVLKLQIMNWLKQALKPIKPVKKQIH